MSDNLKDLELHTAYSDTKAKDYLENPEYLVREVFIRTVIRIMNNSGTDRESVNSIYTLWGFLDEFVSLEEDLKKIEEHKKQ